MNNGRKVVLVTGGTQGIGRATVLLLAQEGYEVHFTFKSSERAAQELCQVSPEQIFAHKLDQGHPEAIVAANWLLEYDWDGIVFNAALGTATVKNYADQGDELQSGNDIALMTVNALGPLWIYKKVYQNLLKRTDHSKLIFISSVGGGISQFPCFSTSDNMSKSAVSYLVRHLAAANVYTTIDVFALCPDSVASAMSEASIMSQFKTPEARQAFIDSQAKKRLGDPAVYAYWIAELLKEESTLLHGANIDASFGLGVRPGIVTEHM